MQAAHRESVVGPMLGHRRSVLCLRGRRHYAVYTMLDPNCPGTWTAYRDVIK